MTRMTEPNLDFIQITLAVFERKKTLMDNEGGDPANRLRDSPESDSEIRNPIDDKFKPGRISLSLGWS